MQSLAPKRVLIVDDNDDIAEFFQLAVRKQPWIVDTANSAKQAQLKHAKNPFDLIVFDVEMPYINGVEMAKELRSHDQQVLIAFLSAYPDPIDDEAMTILHPVAILKKPITSDDFCRAIEAVI